MKHTPGPWRIATTGNYGNIIEAQSGRQNYDFDTGYRTVATFQACESTGRYKEEEENRIANGYLIAAAPELLEALQAAIECGMVPKSSAAEGGAARHVKQLHVADQIRAAISKATGEQQ